MTTSKPEVKRYDCTSGGRSHCYGCYTMTETEDGYYVSAEDYEALQAECEKLRTQLNVLVKGVELLLRRLEKMPRKLWTKEQLGAILGAHYES